MLVIPIKYVYTNILDKKKISSKADKYVVHISN